MSVCPSCGYCPHCGHQHPTYPYYWQSPQYTQYPIGYPYIPNVGDSYTTGGIGGIAGTAAGLQTQCQNSANVQG